MVGRSLFWRGGFCFVREEFCFGAEEFCWGRSNEEQVRRDDDGVETVQHPPVWCE